MWHRPRPLRAHLPLVLPPVLLLTASGPAGPPLPGAGLTSAALHTPAYACIHMALGSRLLLSASHHVPLARVASHHVPLARPQAAVVISLVQKHFESKRRILATSARDQDIPAPSPPPTVLTDAQAAVARALALAPSAASDAPSEMPSEIPSEIPAVPETTPPAVHT